MKRIEYVADDQKHISMCVWDEVENPKAILQIIHGMSEHVERYADFAAFMNANGFIVAGDDHRAHGYTDRESLGLAGSGDLFDKTVNDERGITAMLKEQYKLPVVVMGHSYGSFITQRYLSKGADEIAGVILSGSALMKGLKVSLGYKMAFKRCMNDKGDAPGQTFADMTFVKYDKKIHDGINGWLSRDVEQVGKYNTDPLCGFVCSNGFYKWFFGGLKTVAGDKGAKIRKDLPMLVVSGSMDMVGGCGKLVQKLYERYVSFGLTPKIKLYEGARHEIVNEINKNEVYDDLLAFAQSCLK